MLAYARNQIKILSQEVINMNKKNRMKFHEMSDTMLITNAA